MYFTPAKRSLVGSAYGPASSSNGFNNANPVHPRENTNKIMQAIATKNIPTLFHLLERRAIPAIIKIKVALTGYIVAVKIFFVT
jgi:hypothetical protein